MHRKVDRNTDMDFHDAPLSESNVSLKLAEIQRRCSELLAEPDSSIELSLEEQTVESDNNNPYNRG